VVWLFVGGEAQNKLPYQHACRVSGKTSVTPRKGLQQELLYGIIYLHLLRALKYGVVFIVLPDATLQHRTT
jgi:hypothetical protein